MELDRKAQLYKLAEGDGALLDMPGALTLPVGSSQLIYEIATQKRWSLAAMSVAHIPNGSFRATALENIGEQILTLDAIREVIELQTVQPVDPLSILTIVKS